MKAQPDGMRDGIRFLDENPEPPNTPEPPNSPNPKGPLKKKKKERPVALIAFLAVVAGGLIWRASNDEAVQVREVFEERFEVIDAPRIEVEAIMGSVRIVRGADRAVVCRVEATGKGRTGEDAAHALIALTPRMSRIGDGISVRVGGVDSGIGMERQSGPLNGKVSILMEVPEDAQVRVVSGLGSVKVRDIRGSIAARTRLGKIEVKGAEGVIVLDAAQGSIECEAERSLVLASTSNGSIRFKGSLAEGTSRLVTRNGSVDVKLPEDDRVVVDAKTGNGKVRSDFPMIPEKSPSGMIPVHLIDNGDHDNDNETDAMTRVEIRTSNGSIKVEKD